VRWRFHEVPYVSTVAIAPTDDAALPGQYDAIFCLETLEHLPRPVATLRHFHSALRPGGVLIFDYIRSEAIGLDTAAGLRDRDEALAFVVEHFDVLEGRIVRDGGNLPPTVVRRRG